MLADGQAWKKKEAARLRKNLLSRMRRSDPSYRERRCPEKRREYNREYYARNRDRLKAAQRERRKGYDPEHVREVNRAWQAKNADRRREYKTEYRKRRPEVHRESNRRRYRRLGGQRPHRRHLAELLMRQGFHCALCGDIIAEEDRRHRAEVDHIVPVSKGGGNEIENLQAVHGHCNARKGNRT